jgi:micrococcal nuclease
VTIRFTEVVEPLDFYLYKVRLSGLYDADTIHVDVDLGFGVWLEHQTLRLYGIDAWEMRGEERPKGQAAKAFAEQLLYYPADMDPEERLTIGALPGNSRPAVIRTYKDSKGKYGRWLAEYFIQIGGAWVNLNKQLVANGHAEIVEY